MLVDIGLITAGLVLLFFGAEWLVRGSSALALRLGLTPLVVGLTVVAFGTSSPELLVSLEAALDGNGDIALGNVIGSNIGNIALILGLTVIVRAAAVQRQLLRFDVPVMIGCTVLLIVMLLDERLSRLEGAVLTLGIVSYTVFSVWKARRMPDVDPAELGVGVPAVVDERPWLSVGKVVAGLALLVMGARLLVDGAVAVAGQLGLSEAFIGLTIVAVGTSLPELATPVVAAFRGHADIAVGNIVGSNVFNVLGILGISTLVQPLTGAGISNVDLGMMLFTAVFLFLLMTSASRLVRWEGLVLIGCYVAYIGYLLP